MSRLNGCREVERAGPAPSRVPPRPTPSGTTKANGPVVAPPRNRRGWLVALVMLMLTAGSIAYSHARWKKRHPSVETEPGAAAVFPVIKHELAPGQPPADAAENRRNKLLAATESPAPPSETRKPPDDPSERKRKEEAAARARKKILAEAAERHRAEEKQRSERLRRLLHEGRAALESGKLDVARKAFTDARLLSPHDPEVSEGLRQVQRVQEERAAQKRRKQEEDRRAAFNKLLRNGQASLGAQDYDLAAKQLGQAVQLNPGDPAARTAFEEAKAGQARKQEEKLQRAAEAKGYLTKGRRALRFHDLDLAATAFETAANLAPDDPDVLRAQQELKQTVEKIKESEAARKKRLAELEELARDPAKAEAARQKRLAEEQKKARDAAEAKRKLLAELERKARETEQAEARRKQLAEQEEKAREEARRKQLAEQERKTREAAEAETRRKLLAEQERKARAAAQAEAKPRPPEGPPAGKPRGKLLALEAKFSQHMADGQKALSEKRFADAAREFEEALKLSPGNPEASRALQQARDKRS